MSSEIVSVLVQGGAVGISMFLGWLLLQVWKKQANHVDKMTDVVRMNAEAMTGLKEAIGSLTRSNEQLHGVIVSQTQQQLADFQAELKKMRAIKQ